MEKRFFPLSAITKRISELLEPVAAKQFWVKAEVTSGRERGGSFYCELVETTANGKVAAKISCTIWASELANIRRLFKSRGMNFVLADGTIVGFLCSLQYTPQYGLSLRVIDADPAIAMGEMEIKKREIIERLQKEGLFAPNKQRFVPLLPLKIGLITSTGSAAYNDFIQTLSASGYGFKVYLADAMMQGDKTERSMLKALSVLCKSGVDLIVIARGGGSKTDLYFLDNEAIARSIAACPTPVWTGIGHEIDTSILDHVANQAFKTPTAAAEDLVARFVQMRRQLDESASSLRTVWTYRLKTDLEYLGRAMTGMRQGPRKLLDATNSSLRGQAQDLRHRVLGRMSTEHAHIETRRGQLRSIPTVMVQKHIERLISKRQNLDQGFKFALKLKAIQLDGLKSRFKPEKILHRLATENKSLNEKMATIRASDPQNALQRGFALVYRQDGQLIRSINDVSEKDRLYTHLFDGSVVSEVTAKENKRV